MGEIRQRDSVRLSEAGKQDFKKAKANKRNHDGKVWRYLDIANEAGVSEKTVKRFFSGKEDVDYESAVAIANALEVNDLEKWLEPKESNSPDNTPETPIDWHHVCHEMLKAQQEKQKFRQQITGRGLGHEVNVYVPLGLVKPKEQPRRGEDFQPSADRGMQQYKLTEKEIEQEYQHDEFFQQVVEGKKKNLTIFGEPGAGKSTWLEKIACYVDNPEKGFPICIPLASLGGKALEDYLLENWLEDALPFISPDAVEVTPVLEKKLKELFNSGKVWLLLDGVDEMRLEAYQSPLQTVANQLRGWVDMARVVLTCRLNVWEANPNALPNFETYCTLHFDDEQVGDFIQQWFTQEGKPELGEQLQDKLGESGQGRIRDLIKNPLRLAMLCKTWYLKPGDLPKTKVTLYQRFRDDFYNWKPHLLLTEDLDKQEELHAALSKLALLALEKKLPLREKFAHKEMGKSLFQLAREVGWLNLVYKDSETDEDVYAFFHLTFQEYFAALAVSNWRKDFLNHIPHNPKSGTYRIFEQQWKEVILLWLGRENLPNQEKQEFIKALVEFNDRIEHHFYGHRAFFVAAAGIAEFGHFHWIDADAIVAHLVEGGFGRFDNKQQKWVTCLEPIAEAARAALQETEQTKAIDALTNLIQNSPEKNIQWQAVYSLGKIGRGNPITVKALVEFIQKSQDENTRHRAAQILGRIDKGNLIAADTLVKLIGNSQETSTRQWAADSLAEIGIGNQITVDALVELTGKSHDEDVRRLAAYCLGKIDKDNPTAIATLKDIILKSQDKDICWRAVECIAKIGEGNSKAVAALEEVIRKYQNGFIRWLAAKSLGEIHKGNRSAITVLVELIGQHQNEFPRTEAVESLGEIGKDNLIAIDALVQLIDNSEDEVTCMLSASCLGKVDKGNLTAMATLKELIQKSQNEEFCRIAAFNLGQIDKENSTAITTMKDLIQKYENEDFRRIVAWNLGQIDKGNSTAITTLVELIEKSTNKDCRRIAACSLWQIDKGNPTAIATIVGLIEKSQNKWSRGQALFNLQLIGKGNQKAIDALVKLLQRSQDGLTYRYIVDCVKGILEEEQMAGVVTVLKDYLSDETYNKNFNCFNACYEVIWYCAQTLSYPAFYQAWHYPPLIPHPEIAETTGVGFTLDRQHLTLVELPSLLHSAINSNSELSHEVQLIYIDGSKFIDRDNPATKIYNEMRRQGCPRSEDSKPKTMAQLQDYWDALNLESDKHLVLVFYESTPLVREGTAETVGFSKSFLNDLSKFDGNICVVTEQPDIPLKSFSPSQSNLAEDIVAWIRRVVLES